MAHNDTERLNWLHLQARKSTTGISFDWVPSCEGEPSGFRFMRRHHIGNPALTLRDAIDREMDAALEAAEQVKIVLEAIESNDGHPAQTKENVT